METKRSAPRNAEMWVEFENKVRLHIAMFDKVEPNTSLIPPLGGDTNSSLKNAKSKVKINESLNSLNS
jgi:hypothetical protein